MPFRGSHVCAPHRFCESLCAALLLIGSAHAGPGTQASAQEAEPEQEPISEATAWVAADVVAMLIARAEQRELHASRGWRVINHYEDGLTGTRSQIRSAWFFLHPDGAHDPRAELHATLRAFAQGDVIEAREEPAACALASRWAFLDAELGLRKAGIEAPDCPRRTQWLEALNPERAWLVFPSAYLNSPASMFGHTLLRIDGTAGSEDAPLLAYAVNFAAETNEDNGLVYAVRGLTGGYKGAFSVLPYYEKVREYARIENRDLWEYRLQLDAAQIRALMLHLWMLRGAAFDYYFFTRNCSFQLLTLLEAADPTLRLRAGLAWWAIPTDTVRALAHRGLIGEMRFRPAMATTLAARAEQLTPTARDHALQVARGARGVDDLNGPPHQRARQLDVAHDWLYYERQRGALDRAPALARAREILGARAATGTTSDFAEALQPAIAPEQGHGTRRAALGGFAEDGGSGIYLKLRPAYHDVLDPPGGYGRGSQLEFGDLALRWNAERDRVTLHRFDVIDIVSLSPRDALFRPISWRVATGARRLRGVADGLGGYLAGGPGLATARGPVIGYVFAQAAVDASDNLGKGYSVGAGGLLGLRWQLTPRAALLMEADTRDALAGGRFWQQRLRLGLQLPLARETGLRLSGFAAREPGGTRRGVQLGLVHTFGPAFGGEDH